jgi:hypothetical protein
MEKVKKQGMESLFVPYEIALALKELGFDEPCFGYYHNLGSKQLLISLRNLKEDNNSEIEYFVAPTYSQAFRWFREKHKIQATIEPTKDQHRFELGFNYWIWNTETAEEWFTEPRDRPAGDYVFDTYEEAELECLKKLIEIVRTKATSV